MTEFINSGKANKFLRLYKKHKKIENEILSLLEFLTQDESYEYLYREEIPLLRDNFKINQEQLYKNLNEKIGSLEIYLGEKSLSLIRDRYKTTNEIIIKNINTLNYFTRNYIRVQEINDKSFKDCSTSPSARSFFNQKKKRQGSGPLHLLGKGLALQKQETATPLTLISEIEYNSIKNQY